MTNAEGVCVTGLGGVCALGHHIDDIWNAVEGKRSAIAVHSFGGSDLGPPASSFPIAKLSQLSLDAVNEACKDTTAAQLDSFARFALFAARAAVDDSGLDLPWGSQDTAVVFGHGTNGTATLEDAYARFFAKRSPRLHPLTIPRGMVSSGASAISMALGIQGPVFATSSACASSGHAIAQAAAMIRSGQINVAIAGGSESLATHGMMHCWQAMQAMSSTTCRPFSMARDGMVLGEGGAALVLEATSHARRRGAHIYAELCGEGQTSDAGDITRPTLEGPFRAMQMACTLGRLPGDANVLLAAHGTGTPLNDANEAAAVRQLFDDHKGLLRIIATKSAHGHLLGGSSAIQILIGLLAMRKGVAPPILNFVGSDPECDLPLVRDEPERFAATHMLSNAFGFGGVNVALLFKQPT